MVKYYYNQKERGNILKTKNLQNLCALLKATDIDYNIIAENEISIEAMALGLEHQDPQFTTTNKNLDEGEWMGEDYYIHIHENSQGLFGITILTEIPQD